MAFSLLEMLLILISHMLLQFFHLIVCNHIGQVIPDLIFIPALDRLVEPFLVIFENAHCLDFNLVIGPMNVFSAHLIETFVRDHLEPLLEIA